MAHAFKKIQQKKGAYWNDHTSIGCGSPSENLAVYLHIRRFMAAFVSGSFKSAACQLLCGFFRIVFFYLYNVGLCSVLSKRAYLIASFIVHNPSRRRGSTAAPRCVLMWAFGLRDSAGARWPSANLTTCWFVKNLRQNSTTLSTARPPWDLLCRCGKLVVLK